MKKLFCIVLLLVATSSQFASSMDDPLQQQRFDAVVEQLNNDANPNDVIPMVFDYMEFYIWIGYSDPTKWDPDGDIDKIFGSAYANFFSRMADRLNVRLGQCDPTVMEEVMEYIDFHTVGYGHVRILTNREKIEKSVFWSGYVEWQVNNLIRDHIDEGSSDGPSVLYSQALNHLRSGTQKQQQKAAKSLGGEQPGGELNAVYLASLLSDKNSLVRYWAVDMLSKSRKAAQNAIEQLRSTLSDHSWPVRHKAAELLTQINDRQSKKQAQAVISSAHKKVQPWPKMPAHRSK